MEKVVCLPALMPAPPLGVKVSWYLISCGEVFDTRTSDWNCELMPLACATAGMMSASGGGPLLGEGVTGVTRLTETVGKVTVVPCDWILPDVSTEDGEVSVTVTAP